MPGNVVEVAVCEKTSMPKEHQKKLGGLFAVFFTVWMEEILPTDVFIACIDRRRLFTISTG